MPARQATTLVQRREMLRLVAEEGATYAAVAAQVGVSVWTARKWIRRGKRDGVENLGSCYGCLAKGPLGEQDPLARYLVLRLKKRHPKWGAAYVYKKLCEDSRLRAQEICSASSVLRYWRSFGERLFPKRDPPKLLLSFFIFPSGQKDVESVWELY